MRIIFIGQKGIPATSGGVEKHVEDLSVKLANIGHEAFVYTRPCYTPQEKKEYKGVKLISLPSLSTKHLDAISHTFFTCLDIRKRDADIIHFHSIGPSSLIWLAKLLKPRTPIIFTFHSQCYQHKKWGRFARLYLRFSEYLACKFADQVICVSQELKDYADKKYGINAHYIPNSISNIEYCEPTKIEESYALKKDSYFLIVSRLIAHKGVHYAIKAYNKINTEKKLVIVGDEYYSKNYAEYLKKIAANNPNIIFTGNLSGVILNELFSNAYAYIQPSEHEGLSVSLLEACAQKLPIIASDIRANTDVINGAAFIFKSKDAEDLRKQMVLALENPEQARSNGQKVYENVMENYNLEKIIYNILDIYNNNINAAKQRKHKILAFGKN